MASGVPVVGANEGGTPLTFENRQQGIHFPSHDQDAAVTAIVDVISAGNEMRDRCVPHAQKFTWENSIDELETFYLGILEHR